MQERKLYVGNINYATTVDELEETFSQYGEIEEIKLIEGKGFGFITMASTEEAVSAKEALDGFELAGRNLKVNEARPPQQRDRQRSNNRGGYGGGGGGYGGGRSNRW